MRHHRRWRLTAAVLGAGLAIGVALAGCSSGGGSSSTPMSADGRAEGGAANQTGTDQKPGAGEPNAGQPPNAPNAAQAPDRIAPEDRAIVYTGGITLRVSNVDEAATRAAGLAVSAGGFVGADKRNSKDSESTAQLVLRVPAARFGEVVDALGKVVGTEESRAISTEDVTEQVVDVNSRITIAQASVDRVRALVARAETIGEIVSLESELSRREADLESLKARKRKLDDLTALSTITVTLLGPHATTRGTEPETGFLAGLRSGWHAFLASLDVLLTVLGKLLPWLLALGLPLVAVLWLGRRLRAGRPLVGAMAPTAVATVPPAATAPSPAHPARPPHPAASPNPPAATNEEAPAPPRAVPPPPATPAQAAAEAGPAEEQPPAR